MRNPYLQSEKIISRCKWIRRVHGSFRVYLKVSSHGNWTRQSAFYLRVSSDSDHLARIDSCGGIGGTHNETSDRQGVSNEPGVQSVEGERTASI